MSKKELPQDSGLRFECQRCSRCCRISPGFVYLSKRDLTSLASFFKVSQDEFIEKYCRWTQYYGAYEALCLKETAEYDCVLWDGGCVAYDARPLQCSTYPFWPWVVKDAASWSEEGKSCPGIGRGAVVDGARVAEQVFLHERNVPITRAIG